MRPASNCLITRAPATFVSTPFLGPEGTWWLATRTSSHSEPFELLLDPLAFDEQAGMFFPTTGRNDWTVHIPGDQGVSVNPGE